MEDFKRKTNNIFIIKETLKNQLNILGAEITNITTFRAYADWLDTWTDNLYKKIRDKTVLSHNGLYGKTSQNASPTPEYPSEVKTFSGEQTISVKGKNLIYLKDVSNTLNGLTGTISGNTITINGTNTKTDANWVLVGTGVNLGNSIFPNFKAGETYTLSVDENIKAYVQINYYKGATTTQASLVFLNLESTKSSTFTVPNDFGGVAQFFVGIIKTASDIDTTINIQLEKGEEIENQSFPVSLKSKNIFNSNLIQGGRLFSNGNYFNASNYVHNENPIAIKEGETYTLSANNYSARSEAGFVFFNNGTYVSSLKQQSQTFTAPNGVNQVYCDFYTGSNITPSDITNIQLEKSSEATEYEPFYDIELCDIGGSQDILYRPTGEGKNLFDKDSGFRLGYINASGTFVNSNITACFNQYIPCQPNTTYTISFNTTIYNIGAPIYYDATKTFLSRAATSARVSSKTITTPANCYYMVIQFNYDNSSTMTQEIIDSINCQLEKGSEATEYEEFTAGKWRMIKYTGKIVLDGSEDWSKSSNTSVDRFLRSSTIPKATQGISNYFNVVTSLGTNVGTFYFNERQQVVNYSTYGTTTLATFKTWLETNKPIVYYVLDDPVEKTLTEEEYPTLYKQLNDINDYLIKRFIKKEFLAELDKPVIKEED